MPSTVIDRFSYEQTTCTLIITFRSGTQYAYKNVPEHVYKNFRIAGSKGRYFNFFIKNNYKFDSLDT